MAKKAAIYRGNLPFAAITLVARQADVITSKDSNLLDSASRNTGQ
jgi:hypothetical protein